LFDKFQELGSARHVLLWAQGQVLQLPISRRNNSTACKIEWRLLRGSQDEKRASNQDETVSPEA
jgi:hypothetical protein